MYLVAGLGVTGQSVLRYFDAQGEKCLAFDTRETFDTKELQEAFPNVQFATGEIPNNWLTKFKTVVLSPGIAKAEPWVAALNKSGKHIIGDIELFARAVGVPVIAITGSNGKSTVTTITGMALENAGYKVGVGGNIGEPALDLLIDDNEYDAFVLELSSFQLETTYSLTTASSTVLNISEDHMDRYADIEDYIQAKTKVFAETELAVIPDGLGEQGLIHHGDVVHFSLKPNFIKTDKDYGEIQHNNQAWLGYGNTPLVPVSAMKMQGLHHKLNALAMMALCRPFDIDKSHFQKVLQEFRGLPHRTELVTIHNEISWVNDSKGTNVGATVTALESLGTETQGKIILIAGGVGKEADFSGLVSPINGYCKQVILFGRDQDIIAESWLSATETINDSIELCKVEDLTSAVAIALENAQPQDCVLFSPACASFDQFANYIKRGEKFAELVEQACLKHNSSVE
ncbi:MAG TPA: UDP-N-acetylmuramoyl-L-alanine--D-glutamate ligase [Thiomicrospira sp.]|jgi:UDP-N-acetylmuramoylalanine--D-glutamate ligase|nr:UDP-N-acetylmuramoyl-L-alanine--D-glutamate ligase [Thiomicrospira sp.]